MCKVLVCRGALVPLQGDSLWGKALLGLPRPGCTWGTPGADHRALEGVGEEFCGEGSGHLRFSVLGDFWGAQGSLAGSCSRSWRHPRLLQKSGRLGGSAERKVSWYWASWFLLCRFPPAPAAVSMSAALPETQREKQKPGFQNGVVRVGDGWGTSAWK